MMNDPIFSTPYIIQHWFLTATKFVLKIDNIASGGVLVTQKKFKSLLQHVYPNFNKLLMFEIYDPRVYLFCKSLTI